MQEQKNNYNPAGSNLRRAQLRMLEMLKFIDKICRENGIDYWLDSGTLLGAARHHGYVPWDDDTDICMTYEGMLRFKEIMLSSNPSTEFVLQCRETEKNMLFNWIILRDLKTQALTGSSPLHDISSYKGLQVDIFPVSNESVGLFHFLSFLYFKILVQGPIYHSILKPFKFAIPIAYKFFYHVIAPSFRFLSKPFKKKYYRMTYGWTFPSRRYLADVWPLSRMEFEGCMFPVPGNTDAYLTRLYGNWREMPPEDQRERHYRDVLFLDDPQPHCCSDKNQ